MSESIRGRHWGSDTALRQAHMIKRDKAQQGEAVGIRLATDASEQAGVGGSWRADKRDASARWRVDEWTMTREPFMSFRLVHDNEIEVCMGSNYDLLPHGARNLVTDEDYATTADYNLSFRIVRDT